MKILKYLTEIYRKWLSVGPRIRIVCVLCLWFPAGNNTLLPCWSSFECLSHFCDTAESISNNMGAPVWDLAAWGCHLDPRPRGDMLYCLIVVASRHSELATDSRSKVDWQCRGGAQKTGWPGNAMHRPSFKKLWRDITSPTHTPGIPPQTPLPLPSMAMPHHSPYREQGSLAPAWKYRHSSAEAATEKTFAPSPERIPSQDPYGGIQ